MALIIHPSEDTPEQIAACLNCRKAKCSPYHCATLKKLATIKKPKREFLYVFRGETRNITQWEKHLGISHGLLQKRLKQNGGDFENALSSIKSATVSAFLKHEEKEKES